MPVCIAGMHRSGTSMITKILRGGGLYLGDEADLMPALPDNADGFWENVRFVELNDQLLESQGGWWDCPAAPVDGWAGRAITEHRDSIDGVLAPFTDREPWGWKDPRTSLTIDLWQRLIPELKVVICLRNPLEVALSLKKRNTFSYALSLRLWYAYNQALMSSVPADRRIVTHYATYFEESHGEVSRVLNFAGLPATPAAIKEGVAATTRSLRHSHLTLQHLIDAHVPDHVIQLYLHMCQEAGWLRDGQPTAPVASAPTRDRRAAFVHPSAPHLGAARLDRLAILRSEAKRLREELANVPDVDGLQEANAVLQKANAVLQQEKAALHDDLNNTMARLMLAEQRERPLREMLVEAQQRAIDLEARPAPPIDLSAAKLAYHKLTQRILGTLAVLIPKDSRFLVVSKGDDALLQLDGRTAAHFPQDDTGGYAGYTPADSADAIRRLGTTLQGRECYFVLPNTAFWWLEFYADFARHLETSGKRIWSDEYCIVYALSADPPAGRQSAGRARRERVGRS